jgi:cytochrome c-type biogenesis protein CcmF
MVGYRIFRGNPKFAGGAIAHVGLAFLFLGFVASARYDDKQTVSLEQGKTTDIPGGYSLTYEGNHQIDNERYGFNVKVRHGNDEYTVMPVMRYSNFTQSMMRHPDILNMYTKDFYVSPLSVETPDENAQVTLSFGKGESKELGGRTITFVDFDFNDEQKGNMITGGDVTIGVNLEVADHGVKHLVKPLFKRGSAGPTYVPAALTGTGVQFTIVKMTPNREDPSKSRVEIGVTDPAAAAGKPKNETLIVEASIKPYINLVWMGTVTVVIGFIITIVRRVQEARDRPNGGAPAGDL